jgi:DNA-binding XRE family transcriptional regulator
MKHNRVQEIRESLVMSKSELARKAGISPLTVDRIEKGALCRMATMRKVILALGLSLAERERVFPE